MMRESVSDPVLRLDDYTPELHVRRMVALHYELLAAEVPDRP